MKKDNVNLSKSRILTFLLTLTGVAATAATIPQSTCNFNNTPAAGALGGFSCNLYPSNADGTLNDVVNGIQFPVGYNPNNDPLTPGYVVIVDPGLDPTNPSVEQNQADWLQVVDFAPGTGLFQYQATSINLYTLGCNNPTNPADTSCFPTYSTVTAGAYFFGAEPISVPAYSVPYDYAIQGDPKAHQYNVYFYPDVPQATVPEPASVVTFASAALGLAVLGRRRLLGKARQA